MRPRRIAQNARRVHVQATAPATTSPPNGIAAPHKARVAALVAIALLAAAMAWLNTPWAGDDPLLRQWILQALEHRMGGDPRLLIGVDTPHGAVLDNTFTSAFWTTLAAGWMVLGAGVAAALGAGSALVATLAWGLATPRVAGGLAGGLLAAAVAMLVHDQGAGLDLALAWAFVGAGTLSLRAKAVGGPIAAASLWAVAAALTPAWLWAIPLLAALHTTGRGTTWKAAWAASLFLGGLVAGGTLAGLVPWCFAAGAVAVGALARTWAQRTSWGLAALGTGSAWLASGQGIAHLVDAPIALGVGLAAALATAGTMAWEARTRARTQGQDAGPRMAWVVATAALGGLALAGQAWTPQTKGHMETALGGTGSGTEDTCPLDWVTVDTVLEALDGAGVRRVAAPKGLAWALLAKDMERAGEGNGQGISVVDAGLGGTEDGAGMENTWIVEEAKVRWMEGKEGVHRVGEDGGSLERSEGDRSLWKRSVGGVLVCGGTEKEGKEWEQMAEGVWMERVER